jgi:hypothetical protein
MADFNARRSSRARAMQGDFAAILGKAGQANFSIEHEEHGPHRIAFAEHQTFLRTGDRVAERPQCVRQIGRDVAQGLERKI